MCQGKAFILLILTYSVITSPERISVKARKAMLAPASLSAGAHAQWLSFNREWFHCRQTFPSDLYRPL